MTAVDSGRPEASALARPRTPINPLESSRVPARDVDRDFGPGR